MKSVSNSFLLTIMSIFILGGWTAFIFILYQSSWQWSTKAVTSGCIMVISTLALGVVAGGILQELKSKLSAQS